MEENPPTGPRLRGRKCVSRAFGWGMCCSVEELTTVAAEREFWSFLICLGNMGGRQVGGSVTLILVLISHNNKKKPREKRSVY